ncbi:hypothetical protein AYO21_00924 [Fonsecaea monophora]|uniref:Altered inheritance of mitochondria protein 9, mitochondrial n=1 Tax=Fonsecaea monophora TaxID=254056 RepID=A0A177FNQ6_9EURO|nr:hypothetical protein AYO21_00924 [Fonsecaea monophora]OAG44962.1 hypothetical protein AYO21_00924 [Fonsecaea monophora]
MSSPRPFHRIQQLIEFCILVNGAGNKGRSGKLAAFSTGPLALCRQSKPPGYLNGCRRRTIRTIALSRRDRFDPYAYTSGRWLRGDELERSARHITFDFDALCQRVIELCPGAASISNCEKKEGGFNRVFIFTTDNGQSIVARLPFALAGPPRLTTQSEVATIHYIQANTSIPIPKVLDWCDDASTSIGTEYIIMEHADGVQLHQIWPNMAGEQRIRCIKAIVQKIKEIANVEFPAYGSLYHATARLSSASKVPLNQDFCIGPHCGAMYWNCNPIEPRYYQNTKPNQGPWSDLGAYCDGLIDAGIARIPPDSDHQNRLRYQGSPSDHLHLLDSGRSVIKKMSEDSRILNAAVPTLLHPDFHKRNIFVSEDDPTVVTGIIDWQSASVEPGFWYADHIPNFAMSIPDPFGQRDPDSELCAKAFDACVQFLVPKLAGPRYLDESLFRLFRYCYRTWKDGAVAFLSELIETSQHWTSLGLPGSCPFTTPTPEEFVIHQQYKRFVAAQELKRDLSGLLNTTSEGWVPSEAWETTVLAHKELFANMLEAVLTDADTDDDEPIRDESDLREIWPFDLKDIYPQSRKLGRSEAFSAPRPTAALSHCQTQGYEV